MNWVKALKETYDNCSSEIGVDHRGSDGALKYILLPLCHTSQNAQIDIVLDSSGRLLRAAVVPKNGSQQTTLPATEGSAGRTSSKVAPHPLGDKLQYVAGDYKDFGGTKGAGFDKYIARLTRWCSSEYALEEVKAVHAYCSGGKMIGDLVQKGILFFDSDKGIFPAKWEGDKDRKPEIFSVMQGEQLDCLVRFSVEIPGQPESKLWQRSDVWRSWSEYYIHNKIAEDNFDKDNKKDHLEDGKQIFCFIEGKKMSYAGNHPAKIRNAGDGAKLISSNDTSGFTYRGRFLDDEQTCTIGYETSQKAHNALRWLIAKQGYRFDSFAVVAWNPSGKGIPLMLNDSFDTYFDNAAEDDQKPVDTAQFTATELSKKIAGYKADLIIGESVVVMGLNSATPGRLSVSFFRNLSAADFLQRLENWHSECSWHQIYSKIKKFYGAPAPKDIAWAAYGTKLGSSGIQADKKIVDMTVERILPSIIDGQPLPNDIVRSVVTNASKRIIYEHWEWEKILGISCAVYKYSNKERGYDMALEKDRTTRDYLFGRLLAVADCMEGFALSQAEKGRPTNAARMIQRFAEHPCSTWRTIELALSPYKKQLGHKGVKYEKALAEIMNSFQADDFTKDTALTGEFLLGFHTQRSVLMSNSENENKGE